MTLLNSHPLVLDKRLAVEIGLNEALVLQQVHYWLEINKKNNRNYHEGRFWTYNTINEWQEEFPFWSNSTIKRIFKNLRDMKLIIVDNFNVYQMDRTLWYTINYEELAKITNANEDNNARLDENDQMMSSKEDTVDIENEEIDKNKGRKEEKEPETKVRCHSDKVAQWTSHSVLMDGPKCPHHYQRLLQRLLQIFLISPSVNQRIVELKV